MNPGTLGQPPLRVPLITARYVAYVRGVDFNAANSDTPIPIPLPAGVTNFQVQQVRIGNATASLSTSTWGLFTDYGGNGTTIFAAGQANTITSSAADTNNNMMQATPATAATQSHNAKRLFFRVGTAQGSAAKGDVLIEYSPIY